MLNKLAITLIGSGETNKLLSELMLAMPSINLQVIIDPLAHIQIASVTDAIILTKLPPDLKNTLPCLLDKYKMILLSLDDFPLTPAQENELYQLNDTPYSKRILMGFKKRFQPDYLHIKQALMQKKLGAIQLIKCTERFNKVINWQEILLENIDLIHFLTNDKVAEVFAMTPLDGKPTTTLVISLKLQSGALVVIDINCAANDGYDQRLEIFGAKGSLQLSSQPAVNMRHYTNTHIMLEKLPDHAADYWQSSYQLLLDTFLNHASELPNLHDYVRAKKIVKATETAMMTNQKQGINIPLTLQNANFAS